MTDLPQGGNDNNGGDGHDKPSRLADLLARRASEGSASAPAIVTVAPTRHANISYQSATDTWTDRDTGETYTAADVQALADATPEDTETLIPDDGRNHQHDVDEMFAEFNRIAAKWDEHTFDPQTGAKVYSYSEAERAIMQRQLLQLRASGEEQIEQSNKIMAQRARLRDAQDRAAIAADERADRVAKLTDEEVERIEARQRAEEIVAKRRNGGW